MTLTLKKVVPPHVRWTHTNLTAKSSKHEDCQDASFSAVVDGSVVLAVSDGAGSAARSAEGSRLAMTLVREYVQAAGFNNLTEPAAVKAWLMQLMSTVGSKWQGQVAATANSSDFDATLAVAFVHGPMLGVASVGDSFLAAFGSTGRGELLVSPDRPGSLSGTETYMLPDWKEQTRYTVIYDPGLRIVLLSTDGLEDLLLPRVVQFDAGDLRQMFVGLKPWFLKAFDILAKNRDVREASIFTRASVMAAKGDDVGIAMAVRHDDPR